MKHSNLSLVRMPSRRKFVGGNWKSFNSAKKVVELVQGLSDSTFPSTVDVLIAPTYLFLGRVKDTLGAKGFIVSSQNCSLTDDGAYTGEISAKGLAEFGIGWVILGHSERRSLFGESNTVVGKKTTIALDSGLKVVACIGETIEERKSGRTNEVLADQLAAIASGVSASTKGTNAWSDIVVAYEPVWAIGTGVVATPDQAQETHAFIRSWLAKNTSDAIAQSTRIIYGGSVKPNNAADLASRDDIDGFLVGGASLVAKDFEAICNAAASASKL